MIEDVAVHHNACKGGVLMESLDSVWRQRICGSGRFSDAQIAEIESIASFLRNTRDEMSTVEGSDAGSSSASDYSDSDSYSSNSDSDGKAGEEEEEEEEEEEASLPPPRRRRR